MVRTALAPPNEDQLAGMKDGAGPERARVAILCDIAEENWPSMDLVGEMLSKYLQRDHADSFTATRLAPPLRRRFTRIRSNGHFFNADRLLNRFWDYQRWLQSRMKDFDLFHVVDHSYGQLLHHLPHDRTIVTCHDLDTFRCLLDPQSEPRSLPFRKMMAHVLAGFQKAALVVCDSAATRDELLLHKLVAPEHLRVVPLGVHPTCRPEPDPAADAEAKRLLASGPAEAVNILHVGSTIRRKRIDVLLEVFAQVLQEFPAARLIRAGGPFTASQLQMVEQLKLENAIVVLPHLSRAVLAAVYRQAAMVLLPSDGEGFGLPVIEAMACGTPVVASDLPVLREVGGDAAMYLPIGLRSSWTETISQLVRERTTQPQDWNQRCAAGVSQAAKFSWPEYARELADIYRELLDKAPARR